MTRPDLSPTACPVFRAAARQKGGGPWRGRWYRRIEPAQEQAERWRRDHEWLDWIGIEKGEVYHSWRTDRVGLKRKRAYCFKNHPTVIIELGEKGWQSW